QRLRAALEQEPVGLPDAGGDIVVAARARGGQRQDERRQNQRVGAGTRTCAHAGTELSTSQRYSASRPSARVTAGANPRSVFASVVSAYVSRMSPFCAGSRRTFSGRPVSRSTIASTSLTDTRDPPPML